MEELPLVHESEIEISGDRYQVLVFCREDGRHIARTPFGDDDLIINDGATLQEVLEKHHRLLPLAVTSRKMLRELKFTPSPGSDPGN